MVVGGLFVGAANPQRSNQSVEGVVTRVGKENDIAVRQFHPGETVTYGFKVIGDPVGTVRVRLIQDAADLYTSEPLSLSGGKTFKGSYVLSDSAKAGRYFLGVETGNRHVEQWIPFDVVSEPN